VVGLTEWIWKVSYRKLYVWGRGFVDEDQFPGAGDQSGAPCLSKLAGQRRIIFSIINNLAPRWQKVAGMLLNDCPDIISCWWTKDTAARWRNNIECAKPAQAAFVAFNRYALLCKRSKR